MGKFIPFGKDGQSLLMGTGEGITMENGKEVLSIFGQASFSPEATGQDKARELLGLLEAISEKLKDENVECDALWVQNKKGILTVGGSVDLEKGVSSRSALSKAIKSLRKFCASPEASSTLKAPSSKL